ncbi:uncharacterized protein LOC131825532 [Mustela lutreola]|uniref:uncharacterized protein LOC131825532 n=1 Tax=Mustela lutreola TaxID=9666 RepID=UPI002797B9A2|nr:uncharacterized protein LOC131825532 [Mustela lutreola]
MGAVHFYLQIFRNELGRKKARRDAGGRVLGPELQPRTGATEGPNRARPRAGGPASVGGADQPRSPHDSPYPRRKGREGPGPRPPPASGAGALTHRRGGEEQPASPPVPWLELKRRLLPLRPPRPVHPPPTTPPPGPPPAPPQPPLPPLQPPLPLQPRRGSANRREGARARAPAATAHNLRPQPAAHAGGDGGRAHASGGGDGLGRRSPAHPRGGWAAEKNRPL